MRGFVTDRQAPYARVLQQIVDRATMAQYALNIHKFAGTVTALW